MRFRVRVRVREREIEEGIVALHLPNGPLKTSSGLEPVPECEPSTYHPISR